MNESEIDKNNTIRIREQIYNKLSELGTVKETFNDVIERLINFYEAHNTGMHSSSIQVLKESIDYPVSEEYKKIAIQLFEEILGHENVSFTLRIDPKENPLIENRKNNVSFYRGNKVLCLIRTRRDSIELYLPTEKREIEHPGWKWEGNIYDESSLKNKLKVVERVYADI
jgi:predicted CopG family antitoxin